MFNRSFFLPKHTNFPSRFTSKDVKKNSWKKAAGLVCTLGMGTALIGAALITTPASASSTTVTGKYAISMRGFHVASASISLNTNDSSYDISVDAKVTGLATLIASGSASVRSSGNIARKKLVSDKFKLVTKSKGETFTIKYSASRGRVGAIAIDPPLLANASRVAIKQSHLSQVTDPMSVFVIKSGKLDKSVCDTTTKVFTGIERYNLKLSFAEMQTATSKRTGYQGPVVLCNMQYIPISGHFGSSQMTRYMQDNQRFLVWFAPLKGSDYLIPYRVIIGTHYGDLSMVLTSLN